MSSELTEQIAQNRLELVFAIDNHIVTDDMPAGKELKRLHEDGWIELVLTDVTRTEWLSAKPERQQILLELGIQYAEYYGPLVLGHSRLGSAVLGSPQDRERLAIVFRILFPGAIFESARKQHVRDAMNVATAIRYGVIGFVTRERALLDKQDAIKAAFNDFAILSPEQALAFANRMIERWRTREARRPQ